LIESIIRDALGSGINLLDTQSLGGGCINQASRIETDQGTYFLKINNRVPEDFFEVEAKSLEYLNSFYPGRIPRAISSGHVEGYFYLLTDFIESASRASGYWVRLGEDLAHLHRNSHTEFGLEFDNYIGSLPQKNRKTDNWTDFFVEMRLNPQIERARQAGLIETGILHKFDQLKMKLPDLFPVENPAFVHGDLWSGNLMVDESGRPALIDPAIYYGHREIELAFTQLFGGFDRSFLTAYEENFPLEPGFQDRVDVYNLYPLLVHLNLFGTSYLSGIKRILNRFL
jgi:fructosamine-3-kinase